MSVASGTMTIHRETIHSGQFMVSDFEPESEILDDEYEVGMPIPQEGGGTSTDSAPPLTTSCNEVRTATSKNLFATAVSGMKQEGALHNSALSIDGSLTKLFQCMTLAYRQKLTSPKWNRFKGVRLRWKDKIRLNNVIWRCWHMQFILRQRNLVCQFANPLDVDQHNKPEAVVMEGKYWKRKLSTVAAEYKKWRLFFINKIMGRPHKDATPSLHPISLDGFDWNRASFFGGGPISNLIADDDFLMDFSDTLFSSLSSSQPFPFPNPREIVRAGMVADFIQPGLVQLQPNIEDFMDTFEAFEPLQDYGDPKLPPVPEELDNLGESVILPIEIPQILESNKEMKQRNGGISYSYQPTLDNERQQMFYPMGEYRERGNSNASLAAVPMVPSPTSSINKQSHKSGGRNSFQRNDIFVVPKGKPRGRARSGGSVRQVMSPTSHLTGLPTPINGIAQHSQMASSMMNSTTLLSHLLSNSGSPYGGCSIEKTQQGNMMGNQLHLLPNTPGQQHSALANNQQQMLLGVQQPPWNPKNANETLSPSASMNFGLSKLMVNQNMQSGGMSLNMSGSISPPEISNTPSPPMGPPGGGPTSPPKPYRPKSEPERVEYKGKGVGESGGANGSLQEHRRVCHINAEQKRRCNIKNGFDMLHSLIPQLSHNPNAKVSKAAMLQKGADYIRQLKMERSQLKEEIEAHRQQVEALNSAINNCQSMLPATGAPVSRQRTNKMKEMFDQWVRARTTENWRFWIFSILIRPLLDSYNNAVSTASLDELCRTVLAWVDQHCSLVDLRPAVLNSLRYLCTTTDILSNPSNLPEEACKAVNQMNQSDHQERESRR